MLTLLLLRHAKSSWDQPHLPDSLRPLAPRGRKAAPRVGSYMAHNGLIPDLTLCSPARRAVETWELVSEQLGDSVPTEILDGLYHATSESLVRLVQDLPPSATSVLLVGHNPTFEDLALDLAGTGRADALRDVSRKYPTGALAVIVFDEESWKEVRVGSGYLREFVRPRTLKD